MIATPRHRALHWIALAACWQACATPPRETRRPPARPPDGGQDLPAQHAAHFGEGGERPLALLRDRRGLIAVSDQAIYRLDADGTVGQRQPLPQDGRGRAPVEAVASDGDGLAFALRWTGGQGHAPGAYLVLTDDGLTLPWRWHRVADANQRITSVWDGITHQVAWLESTPSAGRLQVARYDRRRGALGRETLASLPRGARLDAFVAEGNLRLACTTEPRDGRRAAILRAVGIRRWALRVSPAGRDGLGRCALTRGPGLTLTVTSVAPLTPPADAGPAEVFYPDVYLQIVDDRGQRRGPSVPLSDFPKTKQVEQLLLDRDRFLVVYNRVNYRGGRVVLAALSTDGELRYRDHIVALDYEPGRIRAPRVIRDRDRLLLLYGSKRPWDAGLLYLKRFFGVDRATRR